MILLNGCEIVPTIFPDETSQVWKLPPKAFKGVECKIEWRFESEAEFMHLAQLKDLISGVYSSWWLFLPYLPYARQDKTISNGATFALHTFAKLLNTLGFCSVVCVDPHSPVAAEIIDGFTPLYPLIQIENTFKECGAEMACYPDHGAKEKYIDLLLKFPYCYGDKKRDEATGEILEYELHGKPEDKTILIIDDICDGGMTFVFLASALLAKGALEVNLFVSHGIFSKGIQPLKAAGISRIFTKEGEIK